MARSTLELLLESIKEKDEQPPDQLPVLPQRPTSRGRLPSKKIRSVLLFADQTNMQNNSQVVVQQGISASRNGWKQDPSEDANGYVKNAETHATAMYTTMPGGNNIRLETENEFKHVKKQEVFVSLKKRKKDNFVYNWKKDARVWLLNERKQWTLAVVKTAEDMGSATCLADGKLIRMQAKELLPANPEVIDSVDDLTQLSYINEPAILHTLERRYGLGKIYTKAGPMLIAVTPSEKDFKNQWSKRSASPHVYHIADRAFEAMKQEEMNQSILISGDNISRKAETANLVIEYLVSCCGNMDIGHLVLTSQRVLEAFGCAKLLNNPHANRLGKMLHMYYSPSGKLSGAKLETVLFEKSRVSQCREMEQSFDIFYQLCEGSDSSLKDKLNIRTAQEFNYLKCNKLDSSNSVELSEKFQSLLESLNALGFTKQDQEYIFTLLTAVLWLGNVDVSIIDDAESAALRHVSKLLNISVDKLLGLLCAEGNDSDHVCSARDTLAEGIYERLFQWIIGHINNKLQGKGVCDLKCISIVDLPGLELSKRNGLEGLLMNYSHEYLQHFTQCHLYQQNGKDIMFGEPKTDFPRENAVIDFLEQGLFPLLNDLSESSGSDLLSRLDNVPGASTCCAQKNSENFTISHSYQEVTYDTSYLLESLRRHLSPQHTQFINSCIPQLSSVSSGSQISFSSRCQEWTLQMMEYLDNTTPHFILCITPNDLLLQQIRYNWLPEAIRALRNGFPEKFSQTQLIRRYGCVLAPALLEGQDDISKSMAILQCLDIPPHMYQIGLTNLYFRLGQLSRVEDSYNKLVEGIVTVQTTYRCYRHRCQFRKQKTAVVNLQAFVRGWLVRKAYAQQKRLDTVYEKESAEFLPISETTATLEHRTSNGSVPIHGENGNGAVPSEKSEIETMSVALKKKEDENAILRQSLKEYERKWTDYETKMKSMEEMWTKQIESLQKSLSSATRGVVEEEVSTQTNMQNEAECSLHFADSENTQETPSHAPELSVGGRSELDPSRSVIDRLTKEFDHRTQVFNDDADFLVEVKSGQIEANFKPDEELHKLKQRFDVWKRDFKARLKETKGILRKLGKSESAEKKRKRWWSRSSS